MIRTALIVAALATPAHAQYFPSPAPTPNCVDTLTIEDAGEGRAIIRYYNHVSGCSTGYTDKILTTPNGISVSIDVVVNAGGAENQEGITITPLDEGMQAFPPDGLVVDGDTLEIIVQGGVS
jgi:hypothetical protein